MRAAVVCVVAVALVAAAASAYAYDDSIDIAGEMSDDVDLFAGTAPDSDLAPARAWRDEMHSDDDDDSSAAARHMHHENDVRVRVHPMIKAKMQWMMRRAVGGSTRGLTNLFMHAMEKRAALVVLMMLDHNTVISAPNTLPWGGIYKGHRGLLQLGESMHKTIDITNSTFKILQVDEDRGTATVKCEKTGVVRRTGRAVHCTSLVLLTFALNRIKCMDILELNYKELKAAFETRAEAAACRLGETWFTHGEMAAETLALLADNITLTFGAVSPKHLLTIKGKDNLVRAFSHMHDGKPEHEACKLLKCMANHTQQTLVVHSDDWRVVWANFVSLQSIVHARHVMDRFSEGLVLPDTGRIDSGLYLYYTIKEFDQNGKLHRLAVWLNRPLTLLDRVFLRNEKNITISAHGADTDITHHMHMMM